MNPRAVLPTYWCSKPDPSAAWVLLQTVIYHTISGDNVKFTGGCNGNLKGIGALVEGMKPEDVIESLEGTTCGFKSTSCPDQLAQALTAYKQQVQ